MAKFIDSTTNQRSRETQMVNLDAVIRIEELEDGRTRLFFTKDSFCTVVDSIQTIRARIRDAEGRSK